MDDFSFKKLEDLASMEHPTLMGCPFPLRPNLSVVLWLPKDLKAHELKRLTKFMEALIDDAPTGQETPNGT